MKGQNMKELKNSGLPIWYDETSYRLEFRDGLTCAGGGGKNASALKGLLYNEEGMNEQEHCYDFYRDIVFEQHRPLYAKYDFRYDITAIMPGTINGECKKTSGHYHGYIEGQHYTYPEVYEVLKGEAIYILQKVKNFEEPEPDIEQIKAVRVKEGQAIIIPPFWGHCSINGGSGPLFFSNIAVVSCPLFYEPIKAKRGLSLYAVRENGAIKLIKNSNYKRLPDFEVIEPKENPDLGIRFGSPVYKEFINSPEKFDFLLHPHAYLDAMEAMIN
jgi:glucose-6-phosphate isomerase